MLQQGFDQNYPVTLDATRERTASLLAKVLGITALGFLLTAAGVATAPVWSGLPGLIAVFALILGINFARRASTGMTLGMFLALGYFMGWEIAPIIHRYVSAIGPGVVFSAALTTGLGMAALGCIAYLFQIDYRRVQGVAVAGLMALLLVGIASMFLHFLTPDTYAWLTLGVFSLLTVADFARIRGTNSADSRTAILLSVSIYLDGINIFLALLQLLGGRSRRD